MEHPPLQSFTIPEHELIITASRSGGPGGQHVNTSNTRVTVRWNVRATTALTPEEKERISHKLQSQLTGDGDIIIHYSGSRSQQQNKEEAVRILTQKVRQALHVPKKRMKTRTPRAAKEIRLQAKARHGGIKKMRSKKFENE